MSQNSKNKTITTEFLIGLTSDLIKLRTDYKDSIDPVSKYLAWRDGKKTRKMCDHYIGQVKDLLKIKHKDDIFTLMVIDILFVIP